MLKITEIINQIVDNISSILKEDSPLGKDLWRTLTQQHPADIAMIISKLDDDKQIKLCKKLPRDLQGVVFEKIPSTLQAELLIKFNTDEAAFIMKGLHADDLIDLFEHLSDHDLIKYLKLLQTKQRSQLISLLNFPPNSAGSHMHSDVITLQENFTVKKSIALLQRMELQTELFERIYVTNKNNILIGYITLEQLVLNKPETPLSEIIHLNELQVYAYEDQEEIASQMRHYDLLYVPVVDEKNHFLGVITGDDVFDIIEEEGEEDLYKISGLSPAKDGYFATPVTTLIRQRSAWLVLLLIFQSCSSFILSQYQDLLNKYGMIAVFLTMLIGTGGNAGNQSATLVIRGFSTREMNRRNTLQVLRREFGMSLVIASLLVFVSFGRVYWAYNNLLGALTVSFSLFLIVITSMTLGTLIPILLERFDFDPAHSAAPFLATLMDVLGVLIYCFICSKILQ
ncbi:MAG: magnesium transporter [Epsilonproteobacteria bacterium]|nr:magnesium transporter [Campylobacterota bacterium]